MSRACRCARMTFFTLIRVQRRIMFHSFNFGLDEGCEYGLETSHLHPARCILRRYRLVRDIAARRHHRHNTCIISALRSALFLFFFLFLLFGLPYSNQWCWWQNLRFCCFSQFRGIKEDFTHIVSLYCYNCHQHLFVFFTTLGQTVFFGLLDSRVFLAGRVFFFFLKIRQANNWAWQGECFLLYYIYVKKKSLKLSFCK